MPLPRPGIEPGLRRQQRRVLTTRRSRLLEIYKFGSEYCLSKRIVYTLHMHALNFDNYSYIYIICCFDITLLVQLTMAKKNLLRYICHHVLWDIQIQIHRNTIQCTPLHLILMKSDKIFKRRVRLLLNCDTVIYNKKTQ